MVTSFLREKYSIVKKNFILPRYFDKISNWMK